MPNLPIHLLAVLPLFLLFGCASVRYTKVDERDESNGIRFYHSSPYLLVYPNGKGGLVTQILYIADPQKKMTTTTKSFLANAQTEMEFDKGVYKKANNTLDASGVPTAIINAVKTAVPQFLAAANLAGTSLAEREMPAPHLYKIIVKGASVEFIGSQGNIPIHVNLLEQENSKTK